MKIIKAENEKRGWRGRNRKGIPNGEMVRVQAKKKGVKLRRALMSVA